LLAEISIACCSWTPYITENVKKLGFATDSGGGWYFFYGRKALV
jgi:hypothetical protein